MTGRRRIGSSARPLPQALNGSPEFSMFAHLQKSLHRPEGTMSRKISLIATRVLAGTALFVAASLLVHQEGRAQSIRPEQALLNVAADFTPNSTAAHPAPKAIVDGSWALLAKPPADVATGAGSVTVSLAEARP